MKNNITQISAVLVLSIFFAFPASSHAQAGLLDLTFGTNGFVITPITPIGNSHGVASCIAIQSDGKMVVAGFFKISLGNNNIALARYNTDGSLDTTFDNDGKVTTYYGANGIDANSVAIQSDGKIVVGGVFLNNSFYNDFALLRYNTNGSLDTTFDSDGIVTTDIGTYNDEANSVVIQSDGKIVAAGDSYDINGKSYFALVRYNSNGSLDTTFNSNGIVTTDFGITNIINLGHSVAIQANGKIVVAGNSGDFIDDKFALARYNTDGSLDSSFDTDGKVTTAITIDSYDGALSVAIQSDGKIVASGYTEGDTTAQEFALVRYNTNGSVDTSFDSDGIVFTSFGNLGETGKSVAIQSDGKIVVAGETTVVGPTGRFALARYNTNGSLDTAFDTDGKVTTLFGGFSDAGYAVAIQSDDKIVMVGYSDNWTFPLNDTYFGVVRYNNISTTVINTIDNQNSEIKIYPNPFSFSTTIQTDKIFNNVTLIVFNIYGQEVKHLNNLSGQTITLNRNDLPSGVYFIQLKQENKIEMTNKIVVSD